MKMIANGERSAGDSQEQGWAGVFDRHRPLLFSIAYRMRGA
jgi:hypothetical protein